MFIKEYLYIIVIKFLFLGDRINKKLKNGLLNYKKLMLILRVIINNLNI